jgi:chorismate mutase
MTEKRIYGIRGATTSDNSISSIQYSVCELYKTLLSKNNLCESDIVSIQFTLTKELTKLNPATALRNGGYGSCCALFCAAEPEIEGGLKNCIRILITAYLEKPPTPVYLGDAVKLRPDLTK